MFFFGCLEAYSTWLITSEPANQRMRKVLFTCVVYTNIHDPLSDEGSNWVDLCQCPCFVLLVRKFTLTLHIYVFSLGMKPVDLQGERGGVELK